MATSICFGSRSCSAQRHDPSILSAGPGQVHVVEVAGNSPVYSHGWKLPHPVADWVAGKPVCRLSGRILYIGHSSQGCIGLTLYGYGRVSVREPEDKNLDLQVERLVRAGRAEV